MSDSSDSVDLPSDDHLNSSSPPSLTELGSSSSDDESDADMACDFCSQPLGDGTLRFFCCAACDSAIQCEICCFETHLCHRKHPLAVVIFDILNYVTDEFLQEWDQEAGVWKEEALQLRDIGQQLSIHCGSCCVELAPTGRAIPVGTLQCAACDKGLMCRSCCREAHERTPLHAVKVQF